MDYVNLSDRDLDNLLYGNSDKTRTEDHLLEKDNHTIDLQTQKTPVIGSVNVTGYDTSGSRAKVFFTRIINGCHLNNIYNRINDHIYGKVGIKLHTGERNGPNILPDYMVKDLQQNIPDSTIVECNTLYKGDRDTTEKHLETLKINGWDFCPVDIMDRDGYINFPVRNGHHLKSVAMGANLINYDSLLVLTHFKGHAIGGFGGSIKNIGMGCASGKVGKAQVHGLDPNNIPPNWKDWPNKEYFMEMLVDSASAVCHHFGKNIVFINVLRRMSVDCDCDGINAKKPVIEDIGILGSTDLLAIEQASCDLVFAHTPNNKDLVKRIMSRAGLRQLSALRELGIGNPQYEFVTID